MRSELRTVVDAVVDSKVDEVIGHGHELVSHSYDYLVMRTGLANWTYTDENERSQNARTIVRDAQWRRLALKLHLVNIPVVRT